MTRDRMGREAVAQPLAPPTPAPAAGHSLHSWSELTRQTALETLRYSRFVTVMKRMLPLAAAGILAAVVAYSLVPRHQERVTLSYSQTGAIHNDLTMLKPHFSSTDSKGNPYVITATQIVQDAKNQNRGTMKDVEADMQYDQMKTAPRIAWIVVGLIIVGSLLASGRSGPAGNPNLVKIVSSLPRTGSAKAQTDTIVNGIQIALDEAGGKAGPFEVVYADWDDATASAGQWTAEAETANARRAVRDPDVMVYIGTYNSGAAKMSMAILNRAELLMVSPANTGSRPDEARPGRSRRAGNVSPDGRNQLRPGRAGRRSAGPVEARWAQELGVKRVYVLDDNQVYGKGIAQFFVAACQDLGIEVLGQESIDDKAQEFKALMTTIKGLNPDLIYFGGTTQTKGGQIAKDMVAAGWRVNSWCPTPATRRLSSPRPGANNLNDRCYVTFGGMPPEKLTGAGREFVDKYKARYGVNPRATPSTATKRPKSPWMPSSGPAGRTAARSSKRLWPSATFDQGARHLVVRRQRRHHDQDDQRQHSASRTNRREVRVRQTARPVTARPMTSPPAAAPSPARDRQRRTPDDVPLAGRGRSDRLPGNCFCNTAWTG